MSYIILGLLVGGPIEVYNYNTINTSFPSFLKLVKKKFGGQFEIR